MIRIREKFNLETQGLEDIKGIGGGDIKYKGPMGVFLDRK